MGLTTNIFLKPRIRNIFAQRLENSRKITHYELKINDEPLILSTVSAKCMPSAYFIRWQNFLTV